MQKFAKNLETGDVLGLADSPINGNADRAVVQHVHVDPDHPRIVQITLARPRPKQPIHPEVPADEKVLVVE